MVACGFLYLYSNVCTVIDNTCIIHTNLAFFSSSVCVALLSQSSSLLLLSLSVLASSFSKVVWLTSLVCSKMAHLFLSCSLHLANLYECHASYSHQPHRFKPYISFFISFSFLSLSNSLLRLSLSACSSLFTFYIGSH